MKKNIVVCCERMDAARLSNGVYETAPAFPSYMRIDTTSGIESHIILFCPWCGKRLPFPCEDEEEAE